MSRVRASSVVPSIVVLSVVLLFAAASPHGQTRPPQRPPKGPTISQSVRDRAAKNGRVRVIVELRLPGNNGLLPERRLGNAQAILNRRQDITGARGRILASLTAGSGRETRRFQTLPFVALEVGANGLAALQSSPDIERIIPDVLFHPTLEFSVPHIQGDQAWQAGYDGTGTTIAIVDTGVEANHPFLNGKVVAEACFSTTADGLSQSVCPSGETSQIGAGAGAPCPLDDCIHGTHVAGIAAGNGDAAGETFSGVAKGANLVAVQVFSEIVDSDACGGTAPCLGGFESDIIAGLEYVYTLKVGGMNLASVNMSLGGGLFDQPCDDDPIKPAIDNLRALGVATIVASGNAGAPGSLAAPACVSSAISVGATQLDDQVAWFSNVTYFLSLFAPGDGIVSSIPGGDYAELSGTSMAAPHVAGAWAVARQAAATASVDDILAAFRNTGQPVTDTRDWSDGNITVPRIRIFNALAALVPISSPSPTLTAVDPPTGRFGLPLTLTLTGTGFNALSVVRWNGVAVPTVTDSITQLTAVVPAESLTLGTGQVSIFNPEPGGGTSSTITISVLPPPSLTVDQTTVGPNADVTVTLADGYGGQLDWIGLAAAGAPDSNYLASTFVGQGVFARTWTVTMPATPGQYEFRLFLNNGFTRVATSPTFTVDAAITPVPIVASMSPTNAVAGSAPITLMVLGSKFSTSSYVAWNGSPRPTTYVSGSQLQATISAVDLAVAGTFAMTVVTPAPGGGTSTATSFTVAPAPTLTVDRTSVVAGSNVTVTLNNGLGGSLDWLAFSQVGAANNNYMQFVYVGSGVTTRTWTVTASTSGQYEFRLFKQGSYVRAATSPAITATPPAGLTVSQTTVAPGAPVTVTLTNGAGGASDYLALASTSAPDSSFLQSTNVGEGVTTRTWTVNMPATPGTYEFRLFANGVRTGTSPTVTVQALAPQLSVSATTVTAGASVTVTLANGLGGSQDWLAFAQVGAANNSYVQFVYVGAGVTTRTWTVTTPTTTGAYEFRLFQQGTFNRLATSPTVNVQAPPPPSLAISASTVIAGQSATVTLTNGLGGSQDWIAFAQVGAANNNYVQFVYVGAGVTTRTWTITTPTTPGVYEFRLFRQGTFTRIATSDPVTVQAPPPPTLALSTTTASPGQTVTVTLTNGLGGNTDWFAFATVGSADSVYLNWTYVGAGVTTRTWTVTMPSTPGNYEFRLYRQASFVRAATSATIQVR